MSLPESLLLGSSAAVIHLVALTSIVATGRVLPFPWLESFWIAAGYVSAAGSVRLSATVAAIAITGLATWMTGFLMSRGCIATVVGIVEAAAALAWLLVLVVGSRGPRPG
jgi:hypothetical protein